MDTDTDEFRLKPQRTGVWAGVAFGWASVGMYEFLVSVGFMSRPDVAWATWLIGTAVALLLSYRGYRDEREKVPA